MFCLPLSKKMRIGSSVPILFFIALLFSGCGTSYLTVMVQEPAEINLNNFKKIAIGETTGQHADDVADELTSSLVQNGRFEVLDRANLNQVLQEYHLTLSGLVDQQSAAKLGQLIGAAALVFARVADYKYNESIYRGDPWKDKKGNTHQTIQRTGVGTVTVDFKITDLTTGRILISPNITQEATAYTSADNQYPPDIDRESLLAAARTKVISRFMAMIAPHWVDVRVALLSDSDIPELSRGIDYAKQGAWDQAIANFSNGIKNHQGNENLHKAYFDLGVAYEYTNDFKDALEMLNKAYSFKPDDLYANEIRNCKSREAEYNRLQQQLQNE